MAADRPRPRLASSIRARTVAAACLVVSAALITSAVLLLVLLHRTMIRELDTTAGTRAREVADLVRMDSLPQQVASLGHDDALVQVVDRQGRVIAASANVLGRPAMARFAPSDDHTVIHTIHDLPIEEDATDAFRVAAVPATGPSGPVTVYVGANIERVDETVETARRVLVVAVPLLILLVGVTTWRVVGRALRPVDAIRQEVADINASDLERRVPEPPSGDEIARLARTMNAMLDRLHSATQRQRRFVADASHELRSPLAASLADLEVALAHPESARWETTAAALVRDNERMTRLVGDLLFLAQADDGNVEPASTPVDLDEVVRDVTRRLPPRAGVVVDTSGVAPAEVRGSADQLARVVRNLMENAVRHATTRVSAQLTPQDGHAVLVVADDGPGVPPEHADRVFERFGRADSSRSRDTGGAGLGLAIAREIVERHGGSIALAPPNGTGGARFEVSLPLS